MESRYQYRHLEYADSIRLLELEPSKTHQDDLHGTLIHTTLGDASHSLLRPYTALPYVWGSAHRNRIIHLDGSVLEITSSLNAALRDMRDATLSHRIWADALCINQADNAEKSNQVAMMGRIYATAAHTIIHLAVSAPGVDRALDAALFTLHNRSESRKLAASPRVGVVSPDATRERDEKQIEGLQKELLAAPWFTRAWVFQELVLSQNPWVQINQTSRIRWSDFCAILGPDQVLAAMRLAATTLAVPQNHPNPFVRMNETRVQRFAVPLHTLLGARRGIGATDPRDVVYANMSVISDREVVEQYITVDYSRTVGAVFFDTARYVLETAGINFLLDHALGFGNAHSQDHSLPGYGEVSSEFPAWLPNWSRNLETAAGQPARRNATSRKLVYHTKYGALRYYDPADGLVVEGVHGLILPNPQTFSFTGQYRDIVEAITVEIPRSALPRAPSLGDLQEDTYRVDEPLRDFLNPLLRWLQDPRCYNRDFSSTISMEQAAAKASSQIPGRVSSMKSALTRIRLGDPEPVICFHDSVLLETQSPGEKSGCRVAVGKSGALHLVPMATREGDIIADVGSSFLSLVLRRHITRQSAVSVSQEQHLDRRIVREFRNANADQDGGKVPEVRLPGPYYRTGDDLYWSDVDTDGIHVARWGHRYFGGDGGDEPLRVRHCVLVGEASSIRLYTDHHTGQSPLHRMEIFTLH